MTSEQKKEVSNEIYKIIKNLIETASRQGGFTLNDPDVIESVCGALQMNIDELRSNS
mgnify:CR=1 FL=1